MTRARAVVTLGERVDADLEVVDRLATRAAGPAAVRAWCRTGPRERSRSGRSVHRARTFTGLLHEVLAVATRERGRVSIAADRGRHSTQVAHGRTKPRPERVWFASPANFCVMLGR